MTKNEQSILRIGTYFLVLGFICAFLAPMFYSVSYNSSIVCPICVILMCAPRLFYKKGEIQTSFFYEEGDLSKTPKVIKLFLKITK